MTATPRTTAAAATHGPPKAGPPGASAKGDPPGGGFDAILGLHAQARTAPAEGPDPQTSTTKRAVSEQEPDQRESAPAAQDDAAPDAQAGAPEAPAAPVAAPAAAASTPAAGSAPAEHDQTSTTTPAAAPLTAAEPAQDPVLEGTVLPVAQPGVEAGPAGASPMPEIAAPVLEGTGAAVGPAVAPTPGATTTFEKPASGAPTAPAVPVAGEAPAGRPHHQPGSDPQPEHGREPADAHAAAAPVQAPASAAPVVAPAAPTAQPAITAPAPAPAPVAAAAPTPAPVPRPFVAAQVQRIHGLIDLATRNGAARAKLELHPAELGKVEVRLRSAAGGGLTASITADRPEALQALQAAGDQLRQSLQERGVEVLRLDIGLAPHAGSDARAGAWRDGRDADGRSGDRDGRDAVGSDPDDHDLDPAPARSLTPGALVDVRA